MATRPKKPSAAALFAVMQAQAPIPAPISVARPDKEDWHKVGVPKRAAMFDVADKLVPPDLPSRVTVERLTSEGWIELMVIPAEKAMRTYGVTRKQAELTLCRGQCVITPAEPSLANRETSIRLRPVKD
jgi:hypothetical protein